MSEFKQVAVGQMWLGEPDYPWENLFLILHVGPFTVRVRSLRTQEESYISRNRFENQTRYIIGPDVNSDSPRTDLQASVKELRSLTVTVNLANKTATIVMPLDLCHRLEKLINEVGDE